jgi:hypothetical protein
VSETLWNTRSRYASYLTFYAERLELVCGNWHSVLSMSGCVDGFVQVVRQQNLDIISTNCFRHKEILLANTLTIDMEFELHRVVEMVSFVKPKPLKTRLLTALHSSGFTIQMFTFVHWTKKVLVLVNEYPLLHAQQDALTHNKNLVLVFQPK